MRFTITLLSFWLIVPTVAHAEEKQASEEKDKDKVHWGIGAKARVWRVSQRVQRLFVEDSPGPAQDYGAGVDFARRQGSVEVSFGFGFDRLDLLDGYYVEKSHMATEDGYVDLTTFHNLRWFTAEVVVVNHVALHKLLELRIGAGIGIGWVQGEVRKTDAVCTSSNLERDCMVDPNAVDIDEPANIPPVLPALNLLVGLQFKPFPFLHLRIDAGLHTTPYVGAGATFYLW